MSKLDEALGFRRQIDEANQDIARQSGKLESVLDELKTKYGCSTLKEAHRVLKVRKQLAEKTQKRAEDKLDQFKKKWKVVFDNY